MPTVVLVLIHLLAPALLSAAGTALDRYIAKPDPSYKFELVQTTPGDGFTTYVLDLTSQTWRTPAEVDRPVWRHWLTIIQPAQVKSETGFLFITGGSNAAKPPAAPDANLRKIAVDTGSVVAELRMVPNQPLVFAGETKGRVEDSLIAYTWDKYLRGGDETWPARLPMTKSAVRAMDAVTAFCKVPVKQFVVSGASKRGWTTWTTAAVDKRVVAIIPLVIDVLNVEKSFDHHWGAYGFYAPAIDDYVNMKITEWQGTHQYRNLMKVEDPYEYRNRLTMPKLLINSTGDQFFLPDSSRVYFDDLKGEKYLRYVPNTDHSLRKSDAAETMQAFYESIVKGAPRPRFDWKFQKDGSIRVHCETKPTEVKLWQAANPAARDFRLEKIGPAWTSTTLTESGPGIYRAEVAKLAKGWVAYLVEMTFPGPGKHPLKLTTAVRIEPDTLPYPPRPRRKGPVSEIGNGFVR